VLEPLGLDQTRASQRPGIPAPVLHAFSSERREFLGIPDGTPFYEESSFWNPSWTIARGSIQTTDIDDLHATAIAFGTGALLSRASYRAMVSTDLRGFGSAVPGCDTCHQQSERYSYGIGMVTTGDWIMQNPMFAGYSAVAAYLPSQRIAMAVSVTYEEQAFANDGPGNQADSLFRAIAAELAPGDRPPA
jgi:CubicO group peptidase (beta-lactamase class C family)